jgi:hypothetical protein
VIGEELILDKRQHITLEESIAVIVDEGATNLVAARSLEMLNIEGVVGHSELQHCSKLILPV